MKITSLTIMGVITVVLIGAALWISHQQERASSPMERLFPDLLAAINDVSELQVSAQGGTSTMLRRGDVWSVKEKHHYPADLGTIREALIGLAELQILEAKTAKPERYATLGVRDVDVEGSVSTEVTLKDVAGQIMAEVVVGHTRPAGDNTRQQEVFVRTPGDPQTWLAIGNVLTEHNPDEWLDKAFLHIEPKRVRRVSVTHQDQSRLVLEKDQPDSLDYHVVDLPEGREVRSQFTVNNIVSTITSLSLQDVHPKSDVSFDTQAGVVATVETFDGLAGTVILLRRDEMHYVTVSAAFNAALVWQPEPEGHPERPADGPDTPEQEQTDAALETPKIKPAEEVKAEIDALNQTVADWVYVIPQFRADTILTKPADLLAQPD